VKLVFSLISRSILSTHQAGDGQNVNWRNVHLEKQLHNGGGKVRLPAIFRNVRLIGGNT